MDKDLRNCSSPVRRLSRLGHIYNHPQSVLADRLRESERQAIDVPEEDSADAGEAGEEKYIRLSSQAPHTFEASKLALAHIVRCRPVMNLPEGPYAISSSPAGVAPPPAPMVTG